MSDTPALLPPDPSVPGEYWLIRSGRKPEAWTWLPDIRSWFSRNIAGSVVRYAEGMASEGYTLASRRPIPGPAALEAVYQVVETLLDVANLAVITPQDEIHVGPVIYAASGAQVKALRDAAAMLRAALSAMEEPTEAMLAAVEFGDAEGT